jgi:hypothetical protein
MSFRATMFLSLFALLGLHCSTGGALNPGEQCIGKCDGAEIDTDEDGVFDEVELSYGLDPNYFDSDGDGLSDGAEALDQDSDCDGVIDPLDPDFGPATDCSLYPGEGVGDLVRLGDTYQSLRTIFLEDGVVQDIDSNRLFLDGRLQISFGDLNLDGVLSPEDPVIAITAMQGFSGRLWGEIHTGISRDEMISLDESLDLEMEHIMVLPPFPPMGGGEAHLNYTGGFGLLFGFDGILSTITIHHKYPMIPDGDFSPKDATINLGGTVIQCGDGREGGEVGSSQSEYIASLGPPDFSAQTSFKVSIATVTVSLDFYTMLGLTFIRILEIKKPFLGTEYPDELMMVLISPPYAGSSVTHVPIGLSKQVIESEMGLVFKEITEQLGFQIHTYEIPDGHPFGVLYNNDGQADSDEALVFFLNMAL